MRFFRFIYRLIFGTAGRSRPSSRTSESEHTSYRPEGASSDCIPARAAWVIDGDTVSVSIRGESIRVRLSAIDSPEDDQPWGDIAKAGLIKMIGGRELLLETHGIDSHGRTLATIYVDNGDTMTNVNERMVMLGHAWVMRHYYRHLTKSRQDSLDRLELWARSKRVGLWKTDSPVPPWAWRSKKEKR